MALTSPAVIVALGAFHETWSTFFAHSCSVEESQSGEIGSKAIFPHRLRNRPPRLRTDMRAESARRVYSPRRGYGYPNVPALNRARSQDRFSRATKASGSEEDQDAAPAAGGRVRVAIQQHEF